MLTVGVSVNDSIMVRCLYCLRTEPSWTFVLVLLGKELEIHMSETGMKFSSLMCPFFLFQ